MKKSANSNMYEVILDETWGRFASHLEGSREALVCVVSNTLLDAGAHRALESAVAALGYEHCAGVFLALETPGTGAQEEEFLAPLAEAENVAPSVAGALVAEESVASVRTEQLLSGPDLFAAIEGLDPICVIVVNKLAAAICATAYHCEIPLLEPSRLLGRDLIAFEDFSAMLADPQEKQKAWRLLKRLPRLDS